MNGVGDIGFIYREDLMEVLSKDFLEFTEIGIVTVRREGGDEVEFVFVIFPEGVEDVTEDGV